MRTAFLLVGDHHGAEGLEMNAMGKCLPRWESINGDPLPYVRIAVVREYLSWLGRLRILREDPTDRPPESAGADENDRAVLRIDLLVALDQLPTRQRAVIVLRYLDDLTAGQVADILQISEGTVRSHTHDALTTPRVVAACCRYAPGHPSALVFNDAAGHQHGPEHAYEPNSPARVTVDQLDGHSHRPRPPPPAARSIRATLQGRAALRSSQLLEARKQFVEHY